MCQSDPTCQKDAPCRFNDRVILSLCHSDPLPFLKRSRSCFTDSLSLCDLYSSTIALPSSQNTSLDSSLSRFQAFSLRQPQPFRSTRSKREWFEPRRRPKTRRNDDQQKLEAAEAFEERVTMPGRRKGSIARAEEKTAGTQILSRGQ